MLQPCFWQIVTTTHYYLASFCRPRMSLSRRLRPRARAIHGLSISGPKQYSVHEGTQNVNQGPTTASR